MDDRYPYIRFVIGSAQFLAGAVAAIALLGGTVGACSRGGFAGFVSLLVAAGIAAVIWTTVMVWIESLQVFLDLEENTRRLLHQFQPPSAGSGSSSAP